MWLAALTVVLLSVRRAYGARAALGVATLWATAHVLARRRRYRVRMLRSDSANEHLVLECMVQAKYQLFMIDSGYAGPPVLSLSYLATRVPTTEAQRHLVAAKKLMRSVTEEDRNRASAAWRRGSSCLAYTSGCQMRLMSIGTTMEQQADMMICSALRMRSVLGHYSTPRTQPNAEVFVTNPLHNNIHVLTCDYLRHLSPCLLSLSKEYVEFQLSRASLYACLAQFTIFEPKLHGGAFVVPLVVNGAEVQCTLDTGAPGTVCLDRNALGRVPVKEATQKLYQTGANGEHVCSNVHGAAVELGGHVFDVPVFVNDLTIEGVDGYVGLGLLRCFDFLILADRVGVRRNSFGPRSVRDFAPSLRKGTC